MPKSLCIGITSYNCLPYLQNNILSILRCNSDLDIFVIIDDNSSLDGTRLWLQDASDVGYINHGIANVKLAYTLNSFNGYAAYGCFQAINYFLTQTTCDYFLHLDPDCEIRDINAFIFAFEQLEEDSLVGAIGEKRYSLRYQHPKSRSLRAFDAYVMSEWSRFITGRKTEKLEELLLENHPSLPFKVYKELCGNVMFFKREVVEKIGNIDIRRFKMWRWDSEYSMRCWLYGYAVEEARVVRDGKIKHFGGRSRRAADGKDMSGLIGKDVGMELADIDFLSKRYGSGAIVETGYEMEFLHKIRRKLCG